jgi:hypothetical protein
MPQGAKILITVASGYSRYSSALGISDLDQAGSFYSGLYEYWNEHQYLVEPHFGMLFDEPFEDDVKWGGWPSKERFAYQKGAIIGYTLAEAYKDE